MTNNRDDLIKAALEDIDLIEETAGDLDFGYFKEDGNTRMRGNIGGSVIRACDRLRQALQSCLDDGWNSNMDEAPKDKKNN